MFLIDKFQQFHTELTKLKSRVAEGSWVFEAGEAAAPASTNDSPLSIWRRLVSILDRQALDAGMEGGDFALELYRRAQYAMAALADETFINLDWAGRDAWREHLLESKFFGTHRAGEEMFERIEELLHEHDALYAELGRVYLMVLALGFQGRYRGQPGADEVLASYRHRLHRFIYSRDPQVTRSSERVTPQAYMATIEEATKSELPYLKPWIWAIILIIALWLVGGHLIWMNAVEEIRPVVQEIAPDNPQIVAPQAQNGGNQ